MTIHLHLITSHASSVAVFAALVVLLAAHVTRQEPIFRLGYGFCVATAVLAATAYFTGPPTYENLKVVRTDLLTDLVENHAVAGRAAFVVMILVGIVALAAGMQYLQDEVPSKAHRWAVLAGLVVACALLAWAAHLGGLISHPEIR